MDRCPGQACAPLTGASFGWLRRPGRGAFFLLLFLACGQSPAQSDSLELYRKIERYAERHAITRWLYGAVFVHPVVDTLPTAGKAPQRRVQPSVRYKGRIIRRIDVRVFDPFGYSVDDTMRGPTTTLQEVGNRLHRRTRERIVRNLLLFHAGDPVDPLKISESERVLRASPIVNDASVLVLKPKGTKDSVDVLVLVHDKWNFDVSAEGDLSSASMTLRDRNLLGWGQEVVQNLSNNIGTTTVDLSGSYSIYNIKRSYISSTLSYSSTTEADQIGLSFDRPFYSALAEWAGGLALGKTWTGNDLTDPETGATTRYGLTPVALDTWLARSFVLGDGTSAASRSSNVVLGLRYAQTRYDARPPVAVDTLRIFSNSSLLLFSAGLSMRQYYKERYLYRFGSNEDVPEGLLFTVTTGLLRRELQREMPYAGLEISRGGNTERFGYISALIGYGTFINGRSVTDGTLRTGLTWFSDLATIGRWHLREFVRSAVLFGYSKPAYARLTFAGADLYGLDAGVLTGTNKAVLNIETVAYAPYSLLGFRFAPIVLVGLGTVGDEADPFLSNRIYSAYSLGLLIRNENLLVETFQISVGYYPRLPDGRTSVFQLNPTISFSLRARDFAFTRPSVIPF